MGRALIVSAGASSNEYIAARLTEMGYSRPVIIPSGAEARRRMTESDFELIAVSYTQRQMCIRDSMRCASMLWKKQMPVLCFWSKPHRLSSCWAL